MWERIDGGSGEPILKARGVAVDRVLVGLAPAVRPRASLTFEVQELTEDLVALLRRAYKR